MFQKQMALLISIFFFANFLWAHGYTPIPGKSKIDQYEMRWALEAFRHMGIKPVINHYDIEGLNLKEGRNIYFFAKIYFAIRHNGPEASLDVTDDTCVDADENSKIVNYRVSFYHLKNAFRLLNIDWQSLVASDSDFSDSLDRFIDIEEDSNYWIVRRLWFRTCWGRSTYVPRAKAPPMY